MVKPEFNQVKDTKILKLDKDTKYQAHFYKGATHVWVKSGRIGFFICNDSVGDYKSTNQGHFFQIPIDLAPTYVQFPQFDRKLAGFFYGNPVWS